MTISCQQIKQGVTTALGATSAPMTKETDDPVKKLIKQGDFSGHTESAK